MYTEKELQYFVAADTNNNGTFSSTTGQTIEANPGPYISQDLPSSGPVTLQIGGTSGGGSTTTIVPVTCTGINPTSTSSTFTGCTVPSAFNGYTYASSSYVGAPGAATVPEATLALAGEGSSKVAKLFGNNEDLKYSACGLHHERLQLLDQRAGQQRHRQ